MYFLKELLLIAVFSKFVSCGGDDKYTSVEDGLNEIRPLVEKVSTSLFDRVLEDKDKADVEKEIKAVHDAVAKLVKTSEEQIKSSDQKLKDSATKHKLNVEFVKKVFGGSAGGQAWYSWKNLVIYGCVFAGGAILGVVIYSIFSKKD